MRLTLPGLLFLTAPLLAQPTQSDRYKLAPLVSTAKLWNMIRYLHPRVTGNSTAWDSALIAALPKIEAAHSDEDLAVALDSMLKTLHDPCTRIALGLPGPGLTVQSLDSDTMVIHAGNGDLSGTMGAGLMLKLGIPQTSNLVWDLRSSGLPFTGRPDLRQLSLNGLGYAFRQHSGYPPQEGTGQFYYSSSLQIVEAHPPVARKSTSSPRQIYLIDKHSAVPVQAIIDQINSRSAIFSEDPPQDLQAGFTRLVPLLGKVWAEVRLAELYYSDGTTSFAPTRVVLNRGNEAVKAAAEALQFNGWGMPGERPEFELLPSSFRDMPYADNPYPSREMRILAAFRMWGVMHYFNPYVSTLAAKWDDVLVELLPKFSEAGNALQYHLAIAEMAARTGDPTCLARSPELGAIFGTAAPPFEVRLLEGQLVITHVFKPSPAQLGDVILRIDGDAVQDRIAKLSRYFPAPAPLATDTVISRFLLNRPAAGTLKLSVRAKDNTERDISVPIDESNLKILRAHRSGDAIRLLNESTGYADLERVEPSDLDAMFDKFQHTAAIIFDLRGYPRDTAIATAGRLGNRDQPVVAELQRNVVGLGGMVSGMTGGMNDSQISVLQSESRIPSTTRKRYSGKTVALIDNVSPGIAGESAMYFRAANDTVLIGSTVFPGFTGYSTVFDLPGGAKVYFSGEAAHWPDGAALQQGGVHPEVEVVPTVAGIQAGRDEVLDKALAYLSK